MARELREPEEYYAVNEKYYWKCEEIDRLAARQGINVDAYLENLMRPKVGADTLLEIRLQTMPCHSSGGTKLVEFPDKKTGHFLPILGDMDCIRNMKLSRSDVVPWDKSLVKQIEHPNQPLIGEFSDTFIYTYDGMLSDEDNSPDERIRFNLFKMLYIMEKENCQFFRMTLSGTKSICESVADWHGNEILLKFVKLEDKLVWNPNEHIYSPLAFVICSRLDDRVPEADGFQSAALARLNDLDVAFKSSTDIPVEKEIEYKMLYNVLLTNSSRISDALKTDVLACEQDDLLSYMPNSFVSYIITLPLTTGIEDRMVKECWECSKKVTMACNKCHVASYCSEACKEKGWNHGHDLHCGVHH